ncbi:MAG: hypothetical protein M1818_007208 [Claussenomyces sp. TS43310]|nr:MAG: hypothetical protein M1818_007208 [Claussenomyces sp. TS43310]
MGKSDISHDVNRNAVIVCLSLAISFSAARCVARWIKVRTVQLEDVFMWLALICFIAMNALIIASLPLFYGNFETQTQADYVKALKLGFVSDIFFYSALWCVKFSLLFMFCRVTADLPQYRWVWIAIMIFTFLTYVGCIIGHILDCRSMTAWFTPGQCGSHRDVVAEVATVHYAMAVDLLTDLLIMAIPVRLIIGLHINRIEKLSVGLVFSVAILNMIFAIIRVAYLDANLDGHGYSETWLVLWANLEGVVSVIVGCLPSFAIFIKGHVSASGHHFQQSKPYTFSNRTTGLSQPQSSSSLTNSQARRDSYVMRDMESDITLNEEGAPWVVSYEEGRSESTLGPQPEVFHGKS